jgi:tetratricopeptide (TPR) repeat protein
MDVEHQNCTHCGHEMGDYRLGPLYFTRLAADYQQYKRLPKALAALQQAEKLNPNLPGLYRQLGEVLAELGKTRAAIETLQRALQREPKQVSLYLTLGKIFQQEGQWEEAERLYGQALKISSKSSDAHLALGDLSMQRSRLRQAERHLQQAARLNRRNGLAWMRLGQLYDSLNKRGPAAHAYGQAYQWLPRDRPEWHRVQARLQRLDPRLPQRLAQGWSELTRQITGPILVCFLLLLLSARFRPWLIDATGWLALLLAMTGAILWVSGASLPKNPVARLLAGQTGLERSPLLRFLSAVLGAICWLVALGIVLWPLSQSLPDIPGLPF